MSKFKILVKVTGSIAAYKAAFLVSKLVQSGCEVKVVVTNSALQFVGAATFEGLTGFPVYSDTFESGRMMSHINLAKWADLTIVVPADANTINKFASGIADNLVTSLFLAHNKNKPYLIAPAMNIAMLKHPATQNSIDKLRRWGIKILPTASGHLACGDEGEGKLLEPEIIMGYIFNELNKSRNKEKSILITSGATQEFIDKIRFVSNLSTGKTGAELADYFYRLGFNVTLLKSEFSFLPEFDLNIQTFRNFEDLSNKIKNNLNQHNYDAVIHLAAVSDFSPENIEIEGNKYRLPLQTKLSSDVNEFKVYFAKNEKIIKKLKNWSLNKKAKVISFKFLESENSKRKIEEIKKLLKFSDATVFNSLEGREKNVQKKFEIYKKNEKNLPELTIDELKNEIYKIIEES